MSSQLAGGVTLVELMVALAIGSFLLLGAVRIFTEARAAYRAQTLIVRLAENARFALAALEPDVRMAGFLGLTSRADAIAGRASPRDRETLVPFASDCGPNWSLDLDRPVEAWNESWSWTCRPRGQAAPGADTFVIRRAVRETAAPPLDSDSIYIESSRVGAGRLFAGSLPPAVPLSPTSAIHSLAVSGYYVSTSSVLDEPGKPVPSLRRKILRGNRIVDEEVMPGVEDMQLELGIDRDRPGTQGYGAVDRFVNPDDPILDRTATAAESGVSVLALRIWLRLRAEAREPGFTDTRTYRYADVTFDAAAAGEPIRRVVVSKTIYLRNARQTL